MKASDIFNLNGRVALVTGASSGLGARFAQVLAANGAAVALVARRKDRLDELQKQLTASGAHAVAIEADVTDRAAISRAYDQAEKALGGVTILVNNAGVAHSTRAVELSEEEYRRVIGTNLDAVFFVAQEAARRMLAANTRGAIINIASVLGLRQGYGTLPYAASKAGLIQMTRMLALDLAPLGIRVNAIAPGYFETDLTRALLASDVGKTLVGRIPMQRPGQMHELDGPLLLLASDASSFMTGAVLAVDGGHLVSAL